MSNCERSCAKQVDRLRLAVTPPHPDSFAPQELRLESDLSPRAQGCPGNVRASRELGRLPLPVGERDGVRGVMNLNKDRRFPLTRRAKRADLSPPGRGGASGIASLNPALPSV